MASTMLWGHQIVHLLQKGIHHFNKMFFLSGVFLSLFFIYILRTQLFFNSNDWIKGMIPHHSVAITTTKQLLEKISHDENINSYLYRLAKDIVFNQEKEIIFMKNML
jgi:hypothetical protein